MWTLGIDVAKRRHVATLLDEAGKRVFKNFSFAQSREDFKSLQHRIEVVDISTDNLLIGMEATGHYWIILYHWGALSDSQRESMKLVDNNDKNCISSINSGSKHSFPCCSGCYRPILEVML